MADEAKQVTREQLEAWLWEQLQKKQGKSNVLDHARLLHESLAAGERAAQDAKE